jgi:hypothetical protein
MDTDPGVASGPVMPAAGSVNGPLLRAAEPVISVAPLTGGMSDAQIHRRPDFIIAFILRVTSAGTGLVPIAQRG